MKKVIFSLALLLTCSLLGYAQKGISYQAVILDPKPIEIPGQDITGQPFVNGAVSLKFKIFSSNLVQEFEEVHATQTDAYGMVNVLIGSVSPAAFSSVVWDSNSKNLQVWVSFDNGGSYTKVSEQQLTYNPMALFAETASKLSETLSIAGGGTGATTAAGARTNLGLGNVDNTADANKPISIATQAALDTKANANDVTTALGTKANAAEVNTALATKANASVVTASLALKEDVSNKANTPLGSSTTLFPTQNAVKTYVDAQVAGATIADASSSTKGKIQLAGDLSGTAAAPTVPGLALKANASEVNTSLALKAPIASPTFTGTVSGITKSMVGLGSVDNTTDAAKPISTATQTALDLKANAADLTSLATTVNTNTADITTTATDLASLTTAVNSNTASITANTNDIALKAPIASPSFTGTVSGITKSMVGLGSVDNTTDAAKPISTATQAALDLKAPLESPTFTGTPVAPTAAVGTSTTQVATTEFTNAAISSALSSTLTHYIGESYGGGIVFYVYDNGKHGLIAATSDQSSSIKWNNSSFPRVTGARANGVGAGLKNTAIIVVIQALFGPDASAATVCNEYSVAVGGVTYGDWYLPSKHELGLMYNAKDHIPNLSNSEYWSSTEQGGLYAYLLNFSNGENPFTGKDQSLSVRAIRAF